MTHRSPAARAPTIRRRAAGPYLQRRGAIFYFRRRLPRPLAEICGHAFCCLSLHPLLVEAMGRAARLLVMAGREEMRLMTGTAAADAHAILGQLLGTELTRIIRDQDAAALRNHTETDALIDGLQVEATALRRDARGNDFARIKNKLVEAGAATGIVVPRPLASDLGRRAVELMQDILALEADALDGDDARTRAQPLVERYSSASVDDFVTSSPVVLSQTWAKALELYPSRDMKGNIDAIAMLSIVYSGDVSIETLDAERQKAFFAWMSRLPKNHGKAHGKNHFCPTAPKDPSRYALTKHDEIAIADAHDEGEIHRVRALDLSIPEKRALLSELLTARISLETLKRNRNGLNRLMRAGAALGCKAAPAVLSNQDVQRAAFAARPTDPLHVHPEFLKKLMRRYGSPTAEFRRRPCLSQQPLQAGSSPSPDGSTSRTTEPLLSSSGTSSALPEISRAPRTETSSHLSDSTR